MNCEKCCPECVLARLSMRPVLCAMTEFRIYSRRCLMCYSSDMTEFEMESFKRFEQIAEKCYLDSMKRYKTAASFGGVFLLKKCWCSSII